MKILILNSYEASSAPYFEAVERFRNQLDQDYPGAIVYRHLDLMYEGSDVDETGEPIAKLLLSRYADDPPDLVVTVGPPAIDFWVRYRDAVFPDAHLIAMARESYLHQTTFQPSDAVIASRFSFTEAMEDIFQLLPETSLVVLVFGNTYSERTLAEEAQRQLSRYPGNFRHEFTNDLSIPEMQRKLAGLPDGSVVYLGIFSEDVNGVVLQQDTDIAMVRAVSSVPVFGPFEHYLGKGIVGGRLIEADRIAHKMAEAVQSLLGSGKAPREWAIIDLSPPTYDWRELQAWDIDFSRLPPESIVLFKPPDFLREHANWIAFIAFVVVMQSILLVILLKQNRRRREAEDARTSLGSRLITAHEDERRLLARELHDDVSQRLARAAIDAGIVATNPESDAAKHALECLGPELVNISKDVHDMSYRLHPSMVEDLGLVAALNAECDRLRRRTSAEIGRNFGDIPHQVPTDAILCVYRIAQEALNNAIRHARASSIVISLYCEHSRLYLEVDDNGVGFDASSKIGCASLGLSSMQERIALAHGSLEIHSKVGQGTRISASVPFGGSVK